MLTRLLLPGTRHGRPAVWLAWSALAALWMTLYVHAAWGFTFHNAMLR